jgi:cell division cycle protein 37
VELSKEERLGPGGLDPVEVFETLPESMQAAFESKDLQALQSALAALPPKDRAHHMKRCADSGLWVPGKGGGGDGDGGGGAEEEED